MVVAACLDSEYSLVEKQQKIKRKGTEIVLRAIGLVRSKVPHSKLWGITGKGAAPPQGTDEAAFLPPASWGVSSGGFDEYGQAFLADSFR